METSTGFFVDWDGKTRRVASPSAGLSCRVIERGCTCVDVNDADGFVIHQATFFPTLEAVSSAGVAVELV